MQRFAELLDRLVTTPSRNGKLRLLGAYFRAAPDPDRGWALAALTDGLPLRFPLRRVLAELLERHIDPHLYRLSRDYVGDTAETAALLWPDRAHGEHAGPTVGEAVAALTGAAPGERATILAGLLDRLDTRGRWALLKLIGGAPRAGVSARLAKVALADAFGRDPAEIEEVWHAVEPPYRDLFAWLDGSAPAPDAAGRPVFRPLMLSHPLEDADRARLDAAGLAAEWKWDGIRVQIAAAHGEARIFSRAGDDISAAFPDITGSFLFADAVLDGELLVLRDGLVAPFNDLQQRLNRKTVTARMLRDYPAHVRLYDLLFENGEDLRPLPFVERRDRLEAWHATAHPPRTDLSELIAFETFDDLERLWSGSRAAGIEGLMLKQRTSPYLSGRPKGHWWKWKRAALTLDCVLMYAERGSGKRSSFYSDYTFGVWRETEGGGRDLVPVGKAYSGFTDDELRRLDGFVRAHTTEQFGPVRAVEPRLVLEVAFDAVFPSSRHKSGVAMRFPRIHRIRWDKPAEEADTLAATLALIPKTAAAT